MEEDIQNYLPAVMFRGHPVFRTKPADLLQIQSEKVNNDTNNM